MGRRQQYQQGVLESRTRQPRRVKLLPVTVTDGAAAEHRPSSGTIEIEWPDKVRVRVAGEVSPEQLGAVFTALARSR